ncbi:hypothetical protein CapIbe_004484 [Capra ibex]
MSTIALKELQYLQNLLNWQPYHGSFIKINRWLMSFLFWLRNKDLRTLRENIHSWQMELWDEAWPIPIYVSISHCA